MGKKRVSERDDGPPRPSTPNSCSTGDREHPRVASPTAENAQEEQKSWQRVRSSLMLVAFAGIALALGDPSSWKDMLLVAAPDSSPLLAMVAIFGVLVWRRWGSLGKMGLHPGYRVAGFLVTLGMGTSLLPFNSTVTMYELPLFSGAECDTLVKATEAVLARTDFVPSKTRYDSRTEVPLEDLPSEVSGIVSEALERGLLPSLKLRLEGQGVAEIDLDGLYLEHYVAYPEPPPQPHLREKQLTLWVELTPTDMFLDGGVRLSSMGRSVTPAQGNALLIPSKIRHGTDVDGVNAQSGLAGTRSVLVGSVSVKAQSRWQRLVSIFRLWGLFARRVRYLADRAPSGEEGGVGRDPVGSLAGETGVGEGVVPERALDPDGNDPLDF